MKVAEKRRVINEACSKFEYQVAALYEEAYRKANDGKLDYELVATQIKAFRDEVGHPPGYVMEFIRRKHIEAKRQSNTRKRMNVRPSRAMMAGAAQ